MKQSFTPRLKSVLGFCVSAFVLTILFSVKSETGFAQPTFTGGATQITSVCENSGATDITSLFTITDPNTGSTEAWTVIGAPANGSVTTGGTEFSTGGSVTPTGITYTPVSGYSGTDVFTMQVDDGMGGTATTTITVTVSPLPATPAAITGNMAVCSGGTTALHDATTGGTWSSSDNTLATVSSTGVVSGISTGTVTITYTVTNSCGNAIATASVTVNPTLPAITGTMNVCVGATTALADGLTGGSWSTTSSHASVNTTTGVVSGVSAGTATISYSYFLGGCSGVVSTSVTVNAFPAVSPITGSSSVCQGATLNLADVTASGTWSSSNTAVATINGTTGVLTGVTTGTTSVHYSVTNVAGCTNFAARTITVKAITPVAAIGGTTDICVGSTNMLSDATSGGAWSGTNSIASVDASGTVSGLAGGTTTITYSVTNASGCVTTATTGFTVNSLPALSIITGSSTVCIGGTTTLNDATTGGTWNSADNSIATVDASGIVSGVSNGTVNISYSVMSGAGCINTTTFAVTVNPLPSLSPISGATNVCVGATTVFSESFGGGSWSSDNAGIASVDVSGTVTGVSDGVTTITYTGTSTGCSSFVTKDITVDPILAPAAISGATTLCEGDVSTLFDAVSGGDWSSSDASVASIDPTFGDLFGEAAGSATITYSVTNFNGCVSIATTPVVVNALPSVAPISGSTDVCIGSVTSLSDITPLGTWSSSDNSISTVDASGNVTGVAAGSAVIMYMVTNGTCTNMATQTINVNALPVLTAITGANSICTGSSTALTESVSGGTWSSSDNTIATVNSSGLVSAHLAGTATISYTLTSGTGCSNSVTSAITVNPLPVLSGISGSSSVCAGSSTTFSNSTTGGTWSSSNTGVATVGSSSGTVSGVSAGSTNIIYTFTNSNGCTNSVTHSITVNSPLSGGAITSGSTPFCIGTSTTFTDAAPGGVWSASNGNVSVSGGVVTGVNSGTSIISYTTTNSCGSVSDTLTVTIDPLLVPGTITGGASSICAGTSTTFTDAAPGGTWSADNGNATVSGGMVTGVSAGSDIISYTVSNSCGVASATTTITIEAAPGGVTISTPVSPVCLGSSFNIIVDDLILLQDFNSGIAPWTVDNTGTTSASALAPWQTQPDSYTYDGTFNSPDNSAFAITNSDNGGGGTITASQLISPSFSLAGYTTATLSYQQDYASYSDDNNVSVQISSDGGSTWDVLADYTHTGAGSQSAFATQSYSLNAYAGLSNLKIKFNYNSTFGFWWALDNISVSAGAGTTAGTWASSDNSIATVSGGTVNTLAGGTAIITYTSTTSCGTLTDTALISVDTILTSGVITGGPNPLCVGSFASFADGASTGTWDASNSNISAFGSFVLGNTAGTAVLSYTTSNSCNSITDTLTVMVDSQLTAHAITGTSVFCIGSTSILSDVAPGGTWNSNSGTITVDATGTVTGGTAGTAIISYTTSNSCGTQVDTVTVTVQPVITAGSITGGTSPLCVGAHTTYTDAPAGGTWSASNSNVTVAAGVVTGVSAGTSMISYTTSNTCGSHSDTLVVSVQSPLTAHAITGTTTFCFTGSTTLSDVATGGTWSSSNANIAVSGGVVTATAAGSALISYTTTNSCGSQADTVTVTAQPLLTAHALTGGTNPICLGAHTTYTDAVTGGTWSASNSNVTVTGGLVTGAAAGTSIISYTTANTCGSHADTLTITVESPLIPNDVTGASVFCVTSTDTLSELATGGVWSSNNANISINTNGIVTATAPGNALISYTTTNSCGTQVDTATVTAQPVLTPGTLSGGAATICVGAHTTYTDLPTGGTWTTSNANATVTGGLVTGVSAGTTVLSYTSSNTCGSNTDTLTLTIQSPLVAHTITGTSTFCVSGSTSLTDAATGGTWSSSNTNVAVSTGGMVTATAPGTSLIAYTTTNSCGTQVDTLTVTVDSFITTALITGGTNPLCIDASTTYTDLHTGGIWSAGSANVNVTGSTITGVAAGSAILSYTTTNTCGSSSDTLTVSVEAPLTANIISGTPVFCFTTGTTLSDATTGGVWSSSNTAIAISTAGVVTATAAGNALISYTTTNSCGTEVDTLTITADSVITAGMITGAADSLCAGETILYTDATPNGTWSASNGNVGVTGGSVTGLAAGTSILSYTASNTCGSNTDTLTVTVETPLTANIISGTTTFCVSATTTLNDAATGGVWNSDNVAITPDASGVVTATAPGSALISYTTTNSCGVQVDTITVTADPLLVAGTITGGTNPICEGSTTTFTDAVTGGTWSADNGNVTISGGVLNAITTGTSIISYTTTDACGTNSDTLTISVETPLSASVITGAASVCVGSTISLSDMSAGGVWSTADATATVDATGTVTGAASGTALISYTTTNSCGSVSDTITITILDVPVVGAISGATNMCITTSATLTDTTLSGMWSSSDPAIATVDAAGIITGVAAGDVVISFAATNTCGTTTVTYNDTVIVAPVASMISGAVTTCAGLTITLTDSISGGTWSSSDNTIATIDPATGDLTTITSGVVTISYTVGNACGSSTATVDDTVLAVPTLTSIDGPISVCLSTTITLTNAVTGGEWTSSDATVASVDATGIVTGVAEGTAIISYTVGNMCGFITVSYPDTVVVAPVASDVAGATTICIGAPVSLTNATPGGFWYSSDVTVATVDSVSGIVTGVAPGFVTISYTVSNMCGSSTATVADTVNIIPSVAAIDGITNSCAGLTTLVSDITPSGVWSSSDNTIATIDHDFGVITGVAAGTVTLSYAVTNVCGTTVVTAADTISDVPVVPALTGATSMCIGSSVTLADATAGGIWSSSDITVATVDASGVVASVGVGIATISYAVSNSCGTTMATASVAVNAFPVVAAISGTSTICIGTVTPYTDASADGVWSSSDATVASVDASGNVTGAGAGTATITYTVTNVSGCTSFVTADITISPLPVVAAITGTTSLCMGAAATLTDDSTGGIWSSSDAAVVTVDGTGTLTTVGAGSTVISYTITNSTGCESVATTTVTVNALPVVDAITGTTTICQGVISALADASAGGVWSSSDNTVATVDASGNVTGVAAGSVTISYVVTNAAGCTSAMATVFTVNDVPVLSPITGTSGICAGASASFTDTAAGGVWSSSNTSVADVDGSGVVTGIALGSAVISYSVTNASGCSALATYNVTVSDILATTSIFPSGSATLCHGLPVDFTVTSMGGTAGFTYQWYVDGTAIAGATNAHFSADTVGSYSVSVSHGGCNSTLGAVTVIAPPMPVIGITDSNVLFTGSFATYQWFLNGAPIFGATNIAYTETTPGEYSVEVTDGNGCIATSTMFSVVGVAVLVNNTDIRLYPNPATSVIRIDAPIHVNVSVMSADGKLLIQADDATSININNLATGTYLVRIYDAQGLLIKTDKFIKIE